MARWTSPRLLPWSRPRMTIPDGPCLLRGTCGELIMVQLHHAWLHSTTAMLSRRCSGD